jgi:hypothetical protein
MTTDMQDAERDTDFRTTSATARDESRNAVVLLVCVMIVIAMIGLLVDSFTDSIHPPQPVIQVAAAVPVPGASDRFVRADDVQSLGTAPTGQAWGAAAGKWGISAKEARVVVPAHGTSLVTIPVGVSDGRVEAKFARIAPGAGLAFRCRNALNCWRVEVVPQLGTWNVVKRIRGKETTVGNIGTVPVADGTDIAVDMAGTHLTFFVNGRNVKTINDGALVFETGAGLSLREPSSAAVARWSAFDMVPRPEPGALAERDASISDNFERVRPNDLGTTSTGQRWSVVSGRWSVRNGMAASSAPAPDRASLALVDLGSGDGVVQATFVAPQERSGLAFRCRDLDNCWRLEAILGYGTWNVYRIVDGKVSTLGNLGIAPNAPETTVTVKMDGNKLTFYVDGVKQRTITDNALSTEHGAGFVVEPGPFAAASRWTAFAARPGTPS